MDSQHLPHPYLSHVCPNPICCRDCALLNLSQAIVFAARLVRGNQYRMQCSNAVFVPHEGLRPYRGMYPSLWCAVCYREPSGTGAGAIGAVLRVAFALSWRSIQFVNAKSFICWLSGIHGPTGGAARSYSCLLSICTCLIRMTAHCGATTA